MIAALFFLSLMAQPEGVPEVAAEASYYFEIVEGGMQVEERWQLQNQSSREIPASALTLFIDRRAKAIRFPPKSSGAIVGTGAPSIELERPLGPNEGRTFSFSYGLQGEGQGSFEFSRSIPYTLVGAHVAFAESPGMSKTSQSPLSKRVHDAGGVRFSVWDFAAIPFGQPMAFRIDGLPSERLGPRAVSLAVAALVIFWAIWAAVTRRAPGASARKAGGPDSAKARQERLLKALELLERDRKRERIDQAQHDRRQRALLEELAVVLREAQLEEKAPAR